jgi:hypothetical protein
MISDAGNDKSTGTNKRMSHTDNARRLFRFMPMVIFVNVVLMVINIAFGHWWAAGFSFFAAVVCSYLYIRDRHEPWGQDKE